MKKLLLSSLFFLLSIFSFSQKGKVRGVVFDDATGETIISASVSVAGGEKTTLTDLDGKYNLDLEPGTYSILIKFVSFTDQTIKDIEVKAGEVTIIDVRLREENLEELTEVVISAKLNRDNETALLTMQKQSANVIDGVSSQSISKRGDNNAATAAQRITGVSVEGGKYVYIRGLGDRYTKTILNGMEIPGLDPDRNNVQMDIFPSTIIDNLVVYKSFTPDLPGDFTGGMVDISTKSFPEENFMKVTASVGNNSVTHFKNNFSTYKGSSTDFLGFDDGSRKIPFNAKQTFPDPVLGDPVLTNLTKKFNKEMAVSQKTPLFNKSISFSYGKQTNKEKADHGFVMSFNYQNSYQFNEESEINEFKKDPDFSVYELIPYRKSIGPTGIENNTWSALIGKSIKTNKNKISFTAIHIQNGEKTASRLTQKNYELNPSTILKDNLTYNQRSISNANLTGKHYLNKWELNWKVSPTYSTIKDPDIRTTALEDMGNGIYQLNKSVGADITRIYRNLTEFDMSGKADFSYRFKAIKNHESILKFGLVHTYKKRDFQIINYIFDIEKKTNYAFDPNFFFRDDFIWTPQTDSGLYAKGQVEPANTYTSTQDISAIYAMNELNFSKKLKAIYGVRAEQIIFKYTGTNNAQTIVFDDSTVLKSINFLPSLNLIFKPQEAHNIRFSYTNTLARPSFKEKSISQIYDPLQDRRYNGNINLKQTSIQNLDIRWEYFFEKNQMISISGFQKYFTNPIEIIAFDVAPNEVKPINAGQATVTGAEVEIKKIIAFFNHESKKLFFGTNFTFVQSKIDMTKVLIDKGLEKVQEFELRQQNAREGEVIGRYRPMFGQSPFIVNAYLNFEDYKTGLNANISYNVQGKRLAVIGIGNLPDVYEQPFHNISCKISKNFGENNDWMAYINLQNLMNDNRERLYESYNAKTQIYDILYPGRTISLGVTYSIR